MSHGDPKIFLITGVSAGFGLAYSREMAVAGHQVIGRERRDDDWTPFEIASTAGHVPLSGIAYCVGSKFAREGISDIFARVAESFSVKMMAITPGSFRTDRAGRAMIHGECSTAYCDALSALIRKARNEKSGQQASALPRAGQALLWLIEAERPTVHLLLGNDALLLARIHLACLDTPLAVWNPPSRSSSFLNAISSVKESQP